MGELAGGGSVAVAVGVSYMLQVRGDMQHMTHKMGYLASDTLYFIYFFILSFVLLSVHVKKFSVSMSPSKQLYLAVDSDRKAKQSKFWE